MTEREIPLRNFPAIGAQLAAEPLSCPKCTHLVSAAPDGRCPECGTELSIRLAARRSTPWVFELLLTACALSAATGLMRWCALLGDFTRAVSAYRTVRIPWYFLLLEVALLASPFALACVGTFRRRIRLLPAHVVGGLAILAAAPFVADIIARLR